MSSQFSLGSIFVAFCPKGLFIKAVQLLFQPVSPGRCMIFCLNKVNNRAKVYPKNTTTTFIEQTYNLTIFTRATKLPIRAFIY